MVVPNHQLCLLFKRSHLDPHGPRCGCNAPSHYFPSYTSGTEAMNPEAYSKYMTEILVACSMYTTHSLINSCNSDIS